MPHIGGGKVTGSHTTLNDMTELIVRFLNSCDWVTKISIGVVTNNGGKKTNSSWSAKLVDEDHCVLVRASQCSTVSEVRFYASDRQKAKLALAKFIRNSGWSLRFGSNIEH